MDPETARDFVHVDDVCDAFILAAGTALPTSTGIYNVGSGIQTTLGDVVELAREVLAIESEPRWGSHEPRTWDTRMWVADASKIARELGWHPQRKLPAGLGEMARWLRAHPELHKRYGVRSPSVSAQPDR